jgi:hypothetical protein
MCLPGPQRAKIGIWWPLGAFLIDKEKKKAVDGCQVPFLLTTKKKTYGGHQVPF